MTDDNTLLTEDNFWIQLTTDYLDAEEVQEGTITITKCKTKEEGEQLKQQIIQALQIKQRLENKIKEWKKDPSEIWRFDIGEAGSEIQQLLNGDDE